MALNRLSPGPSRNLGSVRKISKPQSQEVKLDRKRLKETIQHLKIKECSNRSLPNFHTVNKHDIMTQDPSLFLLQAERQLSGGKALCPIISTLKETSDTKKIFHNLLNTGKFFPQTFWFMIYAVCDLNDDFSKQSIEKAFLTFKEKLIPKEMPWFEEENTRIEFFRKVWDKIVPEGNLYSFFKENNEEKVNILFSFIRGALSNKSTMESLRVIFKQSTRNAIYILAFLNKDFYNMARYVYDYPNPRNKYLTYNSRSLLICDNSDVRCFLRSLRKEIKRYAKNHSLTHTNELRILTGRYTWQMDHDS